MGYGMDIKVIKESTDEEITTKICKAYLNEEQLARERMASDGFDTLEAVWKEILAAEKPCTTVFY